MPPQFLTREQVRALDRRATDEFGVPGIVLMENAGRGAAEVLRRLGIHGRVVICCGKGNNGGDGFVIARHLALHEVSVRILLFCGPEELSGDAAINQRIAAKLNLPLEVYAGPTPDLKAVGGALVAAEWVVDALFGTGLSGAVRPPLDRVIEAINASPARVLAVDIPSGLDCDSGRPLGVTVRAEHTVTFAAQKVGFANPQARHWLGQVHLVDIGVPCPLPPLAPAGERGRG
jgi:NAD(P)H-hydrate epimerase